MKTARNARRAALRTFGPLAGALCLFLSVFPVAGQQAAPSPKAAAQGRTADGPQVEVLSPYAAARAQVARVVVPDVRGRTPSAAQEILKGAGLTLGTTRQSNGPGTPGTVWQQNPTQKSVVVRGTAVNVEIVTPPVASPDQHDTEFYRSVPVLIGYTPTQAQMILRHAGLNLGNQGAGPGSGAEGTIYAQNPQAGRWVRLGSSVDVQIVQPSKSSGQGGTTETPQVIVPQLLGLNLQTARQRLAMSELQIGSARAGQVSAPAGTIYAQRPQAGRRVPVGTSVDVLVAAQRPAKTPVIVPDVRHRDATTAAAILQHSRLRLGQQTRQESEGSPGLISSQSPQPGTRVEAGSTVDIAVAVEIPPVIVPNVVNLDEGTAATSLGENRLRMGSLTQRDSDEVSGTVLAQIPAAGTRVPRDSSVNLTVSRQIQRKLSVMVDDPNPEAGKTVRFHAHLDREDAGFRYQFIYGDGRQSGWTSRSIVGHAYEAPGAYVVTAMAARGAVKVPSASVGVTAREIEFEIVLTPTPVRAKAGDAVAFTAKNSRADIRPLYQFEFADGEESDWSTEPFAQHSYAHGGNYLTKVRGRVGSGRIVESAAQAVEIRSPVSIGVWALVLVGLTGMGAGAFVYHGRKQFLKLVRAVPRMDPGEQHLEMQNRESSGEDARLRMVWPRGEQLVEWAQGHGPRKAEGHD